VAEITAFGALGSLAIGFMLFGGKCLWDGAKHSDMAMLDTGLRGSGIALSAISAIVFLYDLTHWSWRCPGCNRRVRDWHTNKLRCTHRGCGHPNPAFPWTCPKCSTKEEPFGISGDQLTCPNCGETRIGCQKWVKKTKTKSVDQPKQLPEAEVVTPKSLPEAPAPKQLTAPASKKCVACGRELRVDAEFCASCGANQKGGQGGIPPSDDDGGFEIR
jgi:hypothetical protein